MTPDGYPDDQELELIEKWDVKDVFNMIDFIHERWNWPDMFKRRWRKDSTMNRYTVLELEVHTGGWSGNESLIHAMERNQIFCALAYVSWRRGGHYTFEINPTSIGYKHTKELCRDMNVSRQRIHQIKDKFDWIKPDGKPPMGRPKKTNGKTP